MAWCGPKLSLCCTILSIWGIVQLVIMGGLFWMHSLALAEDLPEVEMEHPPGSDLGKWHKEYYDKVVDAYNNNAKNCWYASGLYVVTLFVALSQLYLNKRNLASN